MGECSHATTLCQLRFPTRPSPSSALRTLPTLCSGSICAAAHRWLHCGHREGTEGCTDRGYPVERCLGGTEDCRVVSSSALPPMQSWPCTRGPRIIRCSPTIACGDPTARRTLMPQVRPSSHGGQHRLCDPMAAVVSTLGGRCDCSQRWITTGAAPIVLYQPCSARRAQHSVGTVRVTFANVTWQAINSATVSCIVDIPFLTRYMLVAASTVVGPIVIACAWLAWVTRCGACRGGRRACCRCCCKGGGSAAGACARSYDTLLSPHASRTSRPTPLALKCG